MKISQAFPSKWLKADDLQGREVKVQIQSCTLEQVSDGEDKETKPVLYFTGKQRGLMMNKTNAARIADAYGDDTDGWVGKDVILFPDKTSFQGRIVDCIRVRTPIAKPDDPNGEPGF